MYIKQAEIKKTFWFHKIMSASPAPGLQHLLRYMYFTLETLVLETRVGAVLPYIKIIKYFSYFTASLTHTWVIKP